MGLLRADNTNFENGVTNRNAANLFGSMGQLDPTAFHSLMEDFDFFEATAWAITGAGGGTAALDDGEGGQILLTTGAAANDAVNIQKNGTGFTLEASRRAYFRAKFQVSVAADSQIVAGLQTVVADPQAPAEGLVFVKGAGGNTFTLSSFIGGVETPSDIFGSLVDATDVTVEFYWDGINRAYFGVDGTPIGFLDLSAGVTGEVLTPTFGIQTAAAVSLTSSLDYLFIAQERG